VRHLVQADGAASQLGPEFFSRGFVWDDEKVGQGRLIPEQDADLKESGVAATDLGQADQFGRAHHRLVRRKGPVAGRQQEPRNGVISRFERCDVGASLLDLDPACREAL
jgi:hypothetical protein